MKIYKLIPERFEQRRKGMMLRVGSISLLIPAAVVGAIAYSSYQRSGVIHRHELFAYAVILPVLTALIMRGLLKGTDRAHRTWRNYEIWVNDEKIVRKEPELPDMELHASEVHLITWFPGDRLQIEATDGRRLIAIPDGLQDFDELRERLRRWAPERTAPSRSWISTATMVLTVATFLLMGFAQRSEIIIASAVILITVMLWAAYAIRQSALYPRKTKIAYTVFCIFVVTIAVFRLLAVMK